MADRRTKLSETREDVFADMLTGQLDDMGMSFQQFSERVEENRDNLPLDEQGAGLAVIDSFSGRGERQDQRLVETDADDLYNARRMHENRSEVAQGRDQATDAQRVTGDFDRWAQAPNVFDFPGVDTTRGIGPKFD